MSEQNAGSVVLFTTAECWRGASVSLLNIARGLDERGLRPHVLAEADEVITEFREAGIPVERFRRGRSEALALRRALRAATADVVLVDRVHDLRVATSAVLGTRVRLLARYNEFRPRPASDFMVRAAYRFALREVVFLSSATRTRVLAEAPFMACVPWTQIVEGIDLDEFRPSPGAAMDFRRAYGLGDEPFVLAVGALFREKRYDVMFDVMARLGSDAPLLVVCGDGPDAFALRARARALDLRVRFLGRIPRVDLIGAYNASLGLLHTGCVETFGLAVAEAMACGRPVIVNDGGALPEVVGVDGCCGTVVPADSVAEAADAVRQLLRDPSSGTAAGLRARERAREQFSLDAMHAAYAALVRRHRNLR